MHSQDSYEYTVCIHALWIKEKNPFITQYSKNTRVEDTNKLVVFQFVSYYVVCILFWNFYGKYTYLKLKESAKSAPEGQEGLSHDSEQGVNRTVNRSPYSLSWGLSLRVEVEQARRLSQGCKCPLIWNSQKYLYANSEFLIEKNLQSFL